MKNINWAALLLRAVHDIVILCGILFILIFIGVI